MNDLTTELERLYFLDGQPWQSATLGERGQAASGAEGTLTMRGVANSDAIDETVALNLVSVDGRVRAMVVDFGRASDWEYAAALYQAVQDDLNLPAPAVSISGNTGYVLWFSLAEAVPIAQARAFLNALRVNYLATVTDLGLGPASEPANAAALSAIALPPAAHPVTGKWSAFIDPTLGGLFTEEPWLEMAPNSDRQADILAGLESITVDAFQQALAVLESPATPQTEHDRPLDHRPVDPRAETADTSRPDPRRHRSTLNVSDHYSDPESFLLAVMNDASASARHRIAAARALLPFSRKPEK